MPGKRTKILKAREIHKMKNRTNQRIEEVSIGTLIVGVDIAKTVHWTREIYDGDSHLIVLKLNEKFHLAIL